LISANDKESLRTRIKDFGIYFEQHPEVFEKTLSRTACVWGPPQHLQELHLGLCMIAVLFQERHVHWYSYERLEYESSNDDAALAFPQEIP
jgi:hypothetical protein